MRTVLLWMCVAIVALAVPGQAGMGLRSMKITRQALQEAPSLEVIVNRIQDIQQAQEFTRVFCSKRRSRPTQNGPRPWGR
jgi:hypothetical protein